MNNELDYALLDKELDKVKTKVFLASNAAFLGPLMCSVNFLWTEDISTAQTNGISLYWNPHWFLSLSHQTRITILLHELWHIAFLHMLRCEGRDPKVWNWACDLIINNMLCDQGYTFDGVHPWLNDNMNKWKAPNGLPCGNYDLNASAEEVYDDLISQNINDEDDIIKQFLWGYTEVDLDSGKLIGDETDLIQPDVNSESEIQHSILNKVVSAKTSAKLSGGVTDLPSEIETMLKKFLNPKLPWDILLHRFFESLGNYDYSWARPNRRYQDYYLPSVIEQNDGLNHLMYFLDVSGSVSDGQVVRFNSEIKYIKDTHNPHKLSLILFDDKIQRVYEFGQNDPFEEIVIVGRGGTDLTPVRNYIIEHNPTAVVIFSDLYCDPMEKLPKEIPTIWVGVNASNNTQVNFGKLIHIKE